MERGPALRFHSNMTGPVWEDAFGNGRTSMGHGKRFRMGHSLAPSR
jgi:hypothetical protein